MKSSVRGGDAVVTHSDYRSDFFETPGVAYLNCAYHGPLPRIAVDAAREATELKANPHRIRDEYHYSFPDAYRRSVASLIGCDPKSVVVADSTTLGVMIVVNGLEWRSGDEVILPHEEFPANLFPWRSLEARGVVVRHVDIDGDDGLAQLDSTIGRRTRVFSSSWVSYTTGVRRDLRVLGELCRSRGVLFVVDGSQGIGGLPFDLRATPCDVLACAGYKWLLGPYGLGFAYVAPTRIEELQPGNLNWFSIDGARDFNRLSRCELAFEPGARRFDMNEAANFINIAAGTASMQYIAGVTPAAVHGHVRELNDRVLASLPPEFHVVGPTDSSRRSNILRVAAESEEATREAFGRLRERGIIVSMREGAIRVSPHVYNTREEIDRLLDELHGTSTSRAQVVRARRIGDPVTPSGPCEAPARKTYRGRWVTLAPLEPEADADDLFSGSHGTPEKDAVWTWKPYGPFADRTAMLGWLQGCARSDDPLFLVVRDNVSGRRIGMVSFLRIDREHRCIEIGHIWYGPEFQRTNANTEAVYLLLCEAFDRLGYRRVEWKCDALNERSRVAGARLGFRFEGTFRQHRITKSRNRDTAWFAMVDSEWPAVKSNIERWLSADPGSRPSLSELNRRASEPAGSLLDRLGCTADPLD